MSLRRLLSGTPAAFGLSCLLASLAATPVIAAPAEPVLNFAIPAGSLDSALLAYASRADVQLLYTPDIVVGRRSAGLVGNFTARAALERLLAGTGIVVQQRRPGVLTLRLGDIEEVGEAAMAAAEVAQAPSMIDEVVVTGSHIRGAGAGAAPIISFNRDEIDRQGYATVAESLNALPQNFSGSATPDVVSTGADLTSQNNGRATSINLRGLGPDATLVLVNGRRMAGTGGKGDFADVSAIPTAAVERIDVLLDGASALYGSDAVGGVVNIILKRDFDGAETRLRYGAAKGGAEEIQFAQTLGKIWSSGRILASYEYYDRSALPFSARAYTATADLRPFGGTDRRSTMASPGNVLLLNPATNASTPTWGIPAGRTQFPLRPGDFQLGVLNLQNPREGMDLLPNQKRHSVYAAAGQMLGDHVEVTADLRFSRRTFSNDSLAPTATIAVAANNPYFASPNGSQSHQITYSFINDLGPSLASGSSESLGVSIGLEAELWGDWRGQAYGAFAQELLHSATDGTLNSLFLREAVGATPDNPATPFRTAVDGFFNPYGDGSANSQVILDFIGGGYSRQRYESQVSSLNAQADGKLWTLAGGEVRLALGAHARRESFGQILTSFTSTAAPVDTHRPTYERTIVAGFAELRAPLVGPGNARPGLERLELSLAGRVEHYDDVGTTADPKFGLIWEPAAGVRFRGTWGTSFRAPTLTEVFSAPSTNNVFFPKGSARVLSLNLNGGNLDLKPETATSWTLGLDVRPTTIPGLTLGATLFDTKFANQIDRPVNQNPAVALTDPALAPFVRIVDPANAEDLAYIQSLLDDPAYSTPGLYPANAFGAVVDSRYVNTSLMRVRGVDLSASYGFNLGEDRFDLAANASYLLDYAQQLTPTSRVQDVVGIAGQPADFRARTSLSWTRDNLGATLAVNRVGAMRAETGRRIKAWTTADLQLRWSPEAGIAEGLAIALNVQNLFDSDPPFYDSPTGVGYDATNAEPLGRYASIQLTKRW